jgi:leucyl aminopeptidase (aminopeptidase T)
VCKKGGKDTQGTPPMNKLLSLYSILKLCLDVKEDESLHVCFQPAREREAKMLQQAASKFTRKVLCSRIYGTKIKESSRSKIYSSDITVFCVDEQSTEILGHSEERLVASSVGKRIAFLLDSWTVAPEGKDLEKIEERARHLTLLLSKAKNLSISTESGILEVDILREKEKREPIKITSNITRPGAWGAIPDYAEVAVAPIEGTASGKIKVNVGITGFGKLKNPLNIIFEEGKLVDVYGEKSNRLLSLLSRYKNLDVLCEVGIGISHINSNSKWIFSQKKKLGYVHLGLGRNTGLGGKNQSEKHIDLIMNEAEIALDKKEKISFGLES